jgi:GDPmannose 4,6-dehydratase
MVKRVLITDISHSVKDLLEYVFNKLDLDYKKYLIIDKRYFRFEELDDLRGDSTKLRKVTGWSPKYTFEKMLDEIIDYWISYYKL